MIIDDRHLFRPGIRPPEDDAPLVVDANGMKARKAPAQSFKPVAGRHGKVTESTGLIHLNQFSQRNSRESGKPPVAFEREQFFRVLIRKGLDHGQRLSVQSFLLK